MKSLGDVMRRVAGLDKGNEPLPNEASCSECGYFDISHPDVIRILMVRDAKGDLLKWARCKCVDLATKQRSDADRRWAQANLPHVQVPKTLDTFLQRAGTEEMLEAAEAFCRRQGPPILVLAGTYGTGKSHLLEAIGRATLDAGATVRYELCKQLLDRLRHTYDDDDGQDLHDLMTWYNSRHLLLLDDVGLEKGSSWVQEQVTFLVETRLKEGTRMVIATNLTKREMADALGPRMASRVYAGNPELNEAKVVVNTAADYRA